MRTVLVVCGAGASSTFLALAMRTRAAEREIALRIEPVSESQLPDRLPGADALLIGTHLANRFGKLQSQAEAEGVAAALLSEGSVGPAGAEQALETALAALRLPPTAAADRAPSTHQTQ